MVNLIIMRHGEAQAQAMQDSQRALTNRGKAEVTQMAQWLKQCYAGFDYCLVSPYLRTRQTAELMLLKQPGSCQLQIDAALVPDGEISKVQNLVDARFAEQPDCRILIVSHMPMVSFLVETFTQAGQAPVFPTAGLVCIDYQLEKGGRLLEKLSPQELALSQHN
ncbi:phosphohistidine phosphatase SixA [Arsukibacterium sp.]|uniref:phosphohistidine phosphatase SixA n=1 Tax=Arsukibacterium sp. TaxID=1977258 RepID=UPI002FDB4E25